MPTYRHLSVLDECIGDLTLIEIPRQEDFESFGAEVIGSSASVVDKEGISSIFGARAREVGSARLAALLSCSSEEDASADT